MGANTPQERAEMSHASHRQPNSSIIRHRDALEQHNPASLPKRQRDDSRQRSGQRSAPSTKRARLALPETLNELCAECKSICWSGIDEYLDYDGIIDWRGKLVCRVGKRYRWKAADDPCPLCRQLRAPWIERFKRDHDGPDWKDKDFGDEIHIFRHLRHLPHVNDFPSARYVLRENNAPYHIAVVPNGQGWKEEFREHVAKNGMLVIISPNHHPEAKLFAPQQVSREFERSTVLPWLKRCAHHQELCNPKSPKVEGMKVIDCLPAKPILRFHRPDYKYVALSYVWGPTTDDNGLPGGQPVAGTTMGDRQRVHSVTTRPEPLQPLPHNARSKSSQVHSQGKVPSAGKALGQRLRVTPDTDSTAVSPRRRPWNELPDILPLTIRDAIQVTKSLGYRYLWVDKYCIDQDNEEEKKEQCSRMGDIYSGSQLTIFALRENANSGLPGVSTEARQWQRQCTTVGKYDLIYTLEDPHYSIHHSRWSERAWTYQEGLFSTRRLFFTEHQVYFECNAMNCTEVFASQLKFLHILSGQRFRALHRAGSFICGNSNGWSHVNIRQSQANHRKVDIIRRCQYQTQQYTRRELTNKDDVLKAYAGISYFYAKSGAQIYSLAGLAIPYPIARMWDRRPEYLNHLSYALAWTHRPWHIDLDVVPKPMPRHGFPSWSWTGWFGEIGRRGDLPYCWTSKLSSVEFSSWEGLDDPVVNRDYEWVQARRPHEPDLHRMLLAAKVLYFDAHVLNPRDIVFWWRSASDSTQWTPSPKLHFYLSIGPYELGDIQEKLRRSEWECVVLGIHGQPRADILSAIQTADKKGAKARNRRIELIECKERHSMVCLIVHTNEKGYSYRIGLLKIDLKGSGVERWGLGPKRSFKMK
ncbi:putative Heterokaryon incompatibility protein-domain-containing protein [Seiridium cardinale]